MRKALALSFVVHALGLVLARPVAHALELAEASDRWTGKTADLPASDTSTAIDVGLEHASSEPAVTAPILAGPAAPAAPAVPDSVVTSARGADAVPDKPAAPRPPVHHEPKPSGATKGTDAARPGGALQKAGSNGSEGGPFGAEGTPSPRDIGYAFTRAIPPANDSDRSWASVAKGRVGKLEIAIHIDETGHVGGVEPRGTTQPGPLVSLVKRTMPMLTAGTFEVRRGSVSEGTEIFEIDAVVSGADADSSLDGEIAGKSDALAFHYDRGRGQAHFKVPSGERVDVSIRVIRVEPR